MADERDASQTAPSLRVSPQILGTAPANADGASEEAPSETRQTLDGSLVLARQQYEGFSPELLSIISHELRSPLAAIKGYAATLRKHEQRLSRAERREFLDAIDEASDRLTAIVERILELSQFELGLVTLSREPLALSRLVREAMATAERRLEATHEAKRHFTFVFTDQTDPTSPASALVLADPRYIRDVVDNLIENAIKYSPNGGVIEISLAPARLASGAGRPALDLIVRDTGIGIDDRHLAQIFEKFQRVDIQSTRATEGLGLGLAICREIVDRHEGEMRAESSPGNGSAFHVVLPLADDGEEIEV